MVRPAVICIKKITQALPPKDALDADEKESLEMSYAAAMYQSGGNVDFRVTAAMATLGVAIPRIIKYLDQREEEQRQKKTMTAKTEVIASADTMAELNKLKEELATLKKNSGQTQVEDKVKDVVFES